MLECIFVLCMFINFWRNMRLKQVKIVKMGREMATETYRNEQTIKHFWISLNVIAQTFSGKANNTLEKLLV